MEWFLHIGGKLVVYEMKLVGDVHPSDTTHKEIFMTVVDQSPFPVHFTQSPPTRVRWELAVFEVELIGVCFEIVVFKVERFGGIFAKLEFFYSVFVVTKAPPPGV